MFLQYSLKTQKVSFYSCPRSLRLYGSRTEFTLYTVGAPAAGPLTGADFPDHLGRGVAAGHDVPGPRRQVLGGLGPEQVGLDAEPRARSGGEGQLCAAMGRPPPVGSGVDQSVTHKHTRHTCTLIFEGFILFYCRVR